MTYLSNNVISSSLDSEQLHIVILRSFKRNDQVALRQISNL